MRVAQAWKVGQSEKKNGAVLFIFSQDRKLYVQVGARQSAIDRELALRITAAFLIALLLLILLGTALWWLDDQEPVPDLG